MAATEHVIVGAGPAGVIAAETLRRVDPDARVTIIGDEPEPPYSRMAIPYLLTGQIDESGTYLRRPDRTDGDDPFASRGIEVVRDRVESVDGKAKTLRLASGETRRFDRLLAATGSRPATPPVPGIDHAAVASCWTLADARRIAERAERGANVVLIGAGFIGCIILEALVSRGVKLAVVETENRMVPRMMNETMGNLVRKWCESKDVAVHTSSRVVAIEDAGDGATVKLESGETLPAALVVCATGVKPNAEWLEGAGVDVKHGVLVDDHLRSSHGDIFAAGDVAEGRDFSTGEFSVHAIQPTAADHGRVAAINMARRDVRYPGSLGMNVLDTLGLISTSFGRWDGVDGGDTAETCNPERYEYLKLCFDGDLLVGASSLGVTEHVGVLRGLIQSRVKLGDWKPKLLREPKRFMEAYLSCTQPVPAAVR